jgi:hypothetical protein
MTSNTPLGNIMDDVMYYVLSIPREWAMLHDSHDIICLVIYLANVLWGFNIVDSQCGLSVPSFCQYLIGHGFCFTIL